MSFPSRICIYVQQFCLKNFTVCIFVICFLNSQRLIVVRIKVSLCNSMLRKAFVNRIETNPKVAIVTVVLVANALVWYFYAFNFLMEVTEGAGITNNETLLVWGINFLGIAVSAFFGSFLIYRLKRRVPFLLYWMLAGTILSLTPVIFNIRELSVLTTFSVFVGVYFGLGMPICMGYYTAATEAGNR